MKWRRIGASPSATVLAFVLAVFAAAGCTADETTQQSPAVRTATPTREAPSATATSAATVAGRATQPPPPTLGGGQCVPPPLGPAVGIGAAFGNGNGPFCVAWRDTVDYETAFRIELSFFPSGEKLTYHSAANTSEYLFPAEAVPSKSDTTEECLKRQTYSVNVVAETAGEDVPIGGQAVSRECSGR